jgi:hypothetical protein
MNRDRLRGWRDLGSHRAREGGEESEEGNGKTRANEGGDGHQKRLSLSGSYCRIPSLLASGAVLTGALIVPISR